MIALVLAIALQQAAASPAPPAFDAAQASVSPARVVAAVDGSTLKGEPIGLAWSSDGSLLYLRAAESDRFGNQRSFHVTVPVAGGKATSVDAAPAWAASYWLWKSGISAPGVPDMKLQTDTQSQLATATGTVRDDGLSQSRADPTQSQIASDYGSAQKVTTMTVKLKGTVVAQSVNKPVVPGATWGWAPEPRGGLAFVDAKKRLVLIDRNGRTFEVPGTADVMLPAWSPDGGHVAFLQKKGRKGVVVSVVEVGIR